MSRVLNQPALVQEKTRAHVLETIRQADYSPQQRKPRSPGDRAANVLLFLFDEADYGFYEAIISGFEASLSPVYTMLYCPLAPEPRRRDAQIEAALNLYPKGIVYALRDFLPGQIELFQQRHIPFLLARKYDDAPASYSCCYVDFTVGSYRMTRHLLSLGLKKVVLLVEKASFQFVASFCGGWKRAYFESELPYDESWIVHTPNTVEGGYRKATELLLGADGPDAFFCASNEMAFGVLRAARDMGIPVPERLAIAGFTDSAVADLSEPALTTIRQPIRQLGAMAARMLLDLIERPDQERLQPQEIMLQPQLCIRKTCGGEQTTGEGAGSAVGDDGR